MKDKKILLHLGCGKRSLKGYINIDILKDENVDLVADISKLPYKNDSVDEIYSCCAIEHFGKNNNLNFGKHYFFH